MSVRMCWKGNPGARMQSGAATIKTLQRVLKKLKVELLYDPTILFLCIYLKKQNKTQTNNLKEYGLAFQ